MRRERVRGLAAVFCDAPGCCVMAMHRSLALALPATPGVIYPRHAGCPGGKWLTVDLDTTWRPYEHPHERRAREAREAAEAQARQGAPEPRHPMLEAVCPRS